MSVLCYRAGPRALEHVRSHGLRGQVRVFVAPATGPKWLVAYGFDRALLESGVLEGSVPAVLAGASAGAWRCLSFASDSPHKTHERLMHLYCDQVFTRADTPATVLAAYARLLEELFGGQEAALLANRRLELVVHTARARGSRLGPPRTYLASLALAAVLNPLGRRALHLALERVSFHTPGAAAALRGLPGRRVALSPGNLLPAALASAAVPLSMEPLREIAGAPAGTYLDGGMTDYHLAEPYAHDAGVTLLFTHQPRIVGFWLDQYLPWRGPRPRLLDTLVHVYPSEEFIARLPGGRVPNRDDFEQLADRPGERIRRWKETARASAALEEAFLRDVETGRFEASIRGFA